MAEARGFQVDDKTRATSLIEHLEAVSKFVIQKYYDVPAGDDEQEAAIKDKLAEVLNWLQQLRRTFICAAKVSLPDNYTGHSKYQPCNSRLHCLDPPLWSASGVKS